VNAIDWTLWDKWLGTYPDPTIAHMVGTSATAVWEHRTALGIAAYTGYGDKDRKDTNWNYWGQFLGLCSDAALARATGLARLTVRSQRLKRGIAAFDPWAHLDWTDVPLGRKSDKVIATQMGCPTNVVKKARRERNIPPTNEPYIWDVSLFGVLSDCEIARRMGCAPSAATLARHRFGIPSLTPGVNRGSKGIDWDKQPLGQMLDGHLARQLGVDPGGLRRQRIKRGIPNYVAPQNTYWDKQPLGQMKDAVLARQLGVGAYVVRLQRVKRGIPSYKTPKPAKVKKVKPDPWVKAELGKVPDRIAASRMHVSLAAARKERLRRGISPCRKRIPKYPALRAMKFRIGVRIY